MKAIKILNDPTDKTLNLFFAQGKHDLRKMYKYAKKNPSLMKMLFERATEESLETLQEFKVEDEKRANGEKVEAQPRWSDLHISDIATSIGHEPAYRVSYFHFSDMDHSGMMAVESFAKFDGDTITINVAPSEKMVEEVLLNALEYSRHILSKANAELSLGLEKQIQSILERQKVLLDRMNAI